jgi:hypothetical protein
VADVTFEDPDFDPGFEPELRADQRHVLHIAVFADNAETAAVTLVADPASDAGAYSLHSL